MKEKLYAAIKRNVEGERKGVARGALAGYGEVDYMLYKDIAKLVDLKSRNIGDTARELGMRIARTDAGWAALVEEQDLKEAEKHLELERGLVEAPSGDLIGVDENISEADLFTAHVVVRGKQANRPGIHINVMQGAGEQSAGGEKPDFLIEIRVDKTY